MGPFGSSGLAGKKGIKINGCSQLNWLKGNTLIAGNTTRLYCNLLLIMTTTNDETKIPNEGWFLTEDDDLDDLFDDTNSILHFQGVVTSVVNGGVRHSQFGELASALDLDTVCDF